MLASFQPIRLNVLQILQQLIARTSRRRVVQRVDHHIPRGNHTGTTTARRLPVPLLLNPVHRGREIPAVNTLRVVSPCFKRPEAVPGDASRRGAHTLLVVLIRNVPVVA
uniref:(northern house mosquito) hypothetical protein n=1 Tax=Culex pipiens TaxID=7175 RepID=A0A8D8BNW1_CULPI